MTDAISEDGQLRTLGLLERLRTDCRDLYGTSSQLSQRVDQLLRQLADPMLQDIPFNLPFRVELWIATATTFAGSYPLRQMS
jgi:hypothetical protein